MNQALIPSRHQLTGPATVWTVNAGRAMAVTARTDGELRVEAGRVWVTVPGAHAARPEDSGDHVLVAGGRFPVRAGQRMVVEAWPPRDAPADWAPRLRWHPAGSPQGQALAQSLRELRQAGTLAGGATLRLLVALTTLAAAALAGAPRSALRWPAR